MILVIILIIIFILIIDYLYHRVTNFLNILLFLFSILFIIRFNLYSNVSGAIVGFILFLLAYFISSRQLGEGDIKFIISLGLLLGFPGIMFLVLNASLLSLGIFIFNKKRKVQILPFAPFLSISFFFLWLLQGCSF